MNTIYDLKIRVSHEKKSACELILIGVFKDAKQNDINCPSELKKQYNALKKKDIFQGNLSQRHLSLSTTSAPSYALIGLGDKKEWTVEKIRNEISKTLKVYAQKFTSIQILAQSIQSKNISNVDAICAITESAILTNYSFKSYLSEKPKKRHKLVLELYHSIKSLSLEKSLKETQKIAEGTLLARELGNEPGNIMFPKRLMKEGKKVAKEGKLSFESLPKTKLKQLKMGGILGVSAGSNYDPYLFILKKRSKKAKAKTVVLVGKGVTFDSGGISLKPGSGMDEMKFDMCGAAAVVGTMKAISSLNLNVNVIGIVPTVENNVCLDPQRPGDILTTYSKKTVEILNTDAEGRLILADALSYSKKFNPDIVIDLATLTGAIVATLGDKAAGLFCDNGGLIQNLVQAGEKTCERLWPMPIWEEYEEMIKSEIADVKNLGGRFAGSITAALFLKQFVPEKVSWAHIDIAGVSWNVGGKSYIAPGGSGYGVRLLTEFLKTL